MNAMVDIFIMQLDDLALHSLLFFRENGDVQLGAIH